MLRRFVDAHSAKIGQDFLDVKKSIPENESSSWKETWDSVTAMLLDSRTAMERPKFPTQRRGDHAAHGTFLLRNHHRNTETHEKIFAVDRTSEGLVFAMYFGKIEADVVDYELLLYTLFKVSNNCMGLLRYSTYFRNCPMPLTSRNSMSYLTSLVLLRDPAFPFLGSSVL